LKVVLIDDHELFRTGVSDFLSASSRYEVAGEAATARAGFNVVASAKPKLVLMDLALPDMDGVVATRELLRRDAHVRVIILSAHERICDVNDALNAGAVGYVRKTDDPATLLRALDAVGRGSRFVSPFVAARLLDSGSPGADVLDVLSQREREIFRLAADCRTAREIAANLCIARKTVDSHMSRINRKLALRDRAELVRLAATLGFVHSIRSDRRMYASHDDPSCSNEVRP
jgi:DNA-binding NarL/FixJ family response regulator